MRSEAGLRGPLSYSELVELILVGQVDSDTMLSRGGGPFERAAAVDELRRFLRTPALQWREREFANVTWEGTLARGSLLPVVHRLLRLHETGVLHMRDGPRQKKIYFTDGELDYVRPTAGEILGEQLVATNVCLRMEIDMALAVLHRYDGRLGDALVGLGAVRPMALARAVQGQVRRRLLEAFRWQAGTWRFVRGARSEEETFAIQIDPFELLRDAALEVHSNDVADALDSLGDRMVVRNAHAPLPLSVFRVPPAWHALIEQVNGQASLSAIVAHESARRGLEIDDVRRALYLGLSCELLRAT